jgi:hypothetical protein
MFAPSVRQNLSQLALKLPFYATCQSHLSAAVAFLCKEEEHSLNLYQIIQMRIFFVTYLM